MYKKQTPFDFCIYPVYTHTQPDKSHPLFIRGALNIFIFRSSFQFYFYCVPCFFPRSDGVAATLLALRFALVLPSLPCLLAATAAAAATRGEGAAM